MKKPKLLLIGNGMAGCPTPAELLKPKADLHEVVVFAAESCPNDKRILLSPGRVHGG